LKPWAESYCFFGTKNHPKPCLRAIRDDNDFGHPAGTELSASLPRHFVPGYYQPVPPGQKPFAHRKASYRVSIYGVEPGIPQKTCQLCTGKKTEAAAHRQVAFISILNVSPTRNRYQALNLR
jgi:hypothetical protein